MSTTTLLRELLRQRHLKYETFCAEYEKAAIEVAPDAVAPSRAQFYRWTFGQLKGGVPYPDACRVLESMFPRGAQRTCSARTSPTGTCSQTYLLPLSQGCSWT